MAIFMRYFLLFCCKTLACSTFCRLIPVVSFAEQKCSNKNVASENEANKIISKKLDGIYRINT